MKTLNQNATPINARRLARSGDARALLAIEEARDDLRRLIEKRPVDKNGRRYGWAAPLKAADLADRKTIAAAKAILIARDARRAARESIPTATPGRILKMQKRKRLDKTESLVQEAFNGLYRTYSDQISLKFGEPSVNVLTTTKWVSGRRGFGHVTDSQVTQIRVPESWVADVSARDLDYLDGMLTLSAEPIDSGTDGIELYRSVWVVQRRGYELGIEGGLIARHTASRTTYHSTTTEKVAVEVSPREWRHPYSVKAAVAGVKRKLTAQGISSEERRAKQAASAAKRAAHQAEQLGKLVDRLTKWDFSEISHVIVDRDHSLKAGNCESGTDQFIQRFFPDRSESRATIGEIATRVGTLRATDLGATDLTLARQLAAACLVAIRRDKQARRALLV